MIQANPANPESEPFTVLDWVGVVVVGFAVLGLCAFPLFASPFKAMYGDFGGALPWLTRLVIQPWAGPLLAMVPLGIMVKGVRTARPLAKRRMLVIVAFIVSCATIAVCVEGLYIPLIELGENVSPE